MKSSNRRSTTYKQKGLESDAVGLTSSVVISVWHRPPRRSRWPRRSVGWRSRWAISAGGDVGGLHPDGDGRAGLSRTEPGDPRLRHDVHLGDQGLRPPHRLDRRLGAGRRRGSSSWPTPPTSSASTRCSCRRRSPAPIPSRLADNKLLVMAIALLFVARHDVDQLPRHRRRRPDAVLPGGRAVRGAGRGRRRWLWSRVQRHRDAKAPGAGRRPGSNPFADRRLRVVRAGRSCWRSSSTGAGTRCWRSTRRPRTRERTPGRAALISTVLLLGIYLLFTVAMVAYAGTGRTGLGSAEERRRHLRGGRRTPAGQLGALLCCSAGADQRGRVDADHDHADRARHAGDGACTRPCRAAFATVQPVPGRRRSRR